MTYQLPVIRRWPVEFRGEMTRGEWRSNFHGDTYEDAVTEFERLLKAREVGGLDKEDEFRVVEVTIIGIVQVHAPPVSQLMSSSVVEECEE